MKINPLNVKGKYYINIDSCTCMGACELAAPNNIKVDEKSLTSYVFKQPETQAEEEACEEALMCCAFEAVLDDGEMETQ